MKPAWMLATLAALPFVAGPAPASRSENVVVKLPPEGLPPEDPLRQAQGVTREAFIYDPKELNSERLSFAGSVTVPKERFLAFFDRCLREREIVHLETAESGQTIHTLFKLGQPSSRASIMLKQRAPILSNEEVLRLSDRATLVTTTVSLKNLPAREAVNSLSQYFSEQATETIRNIEGTEMIVMTGRASSVAAIVRMLAEMDAKAVESPEPKAIEKMENRLRKVEAEVAALQKAGEKPAGK